MNGTDVFFRSSDGLDLYARSYGPEDAPLTVLCLHGFTRNHKDFEPMIAALDAPYRFVSVDVRGRGRSARDPYPAGYTPVRYARDVTDLIAFLKLDRICLIGTSMGGLVAMILMATLPDRICGIVLNDVGPKVEFGGLQRIAKTAGSAAPVADWDSAARAVAAAQGAVFPGLPESDWMAFARRTYVETGDGQIVPDFDPAIVSAPASKPPGLMARLAAWRLFAKLNSVPLLVVRGQNSDILSAGTAARMLRRHRNASLVEVPGRGHAPLLDEPGAVHAIRTFLARVSDPA